MATAAKSLRNGRVPGLARSPVEADLLAACAGPSFGACSAVAQAWAERSQSFQPSFVAGPVALPRQPTRQLLPSVES